MKNHKERWCALLLGLPADLWNTLDRVFEKESESNTTQQTQEQTESQQTEETAERRKQLIPAPK